MCKIRPDLVTMLLFTWKSIGLHFLITCLVILRVYQLQHIWLICTRSGLFLNVSCLYSTMKGTRIFFFFFGHKDWVSLCRLQFSDKRPKYAIWLLRQISQTHHTKSKRKEWQIHWSVNVQFSLSSMHLMTYYFSKFLTTITEINLILLYNY